MTKNSMTPQFIQQNADKTAQQQNLQDVLMKSADVQNYGGQTPAQAFSRGSVVPAASSGGLLGTAASVAQTPTAFQTPANGVFLSPAQKYGQPRTY